VDWSDLKFLLALKRAGSLAGAARALHVDDSTVSRRLAALEETLGTQLFRRSPDGLVFTPAGCAAAETAAQMELEIARLEKTIAGADDTDEGTVKLTFPEGFMPYIVEGVAQLTCKHPRLNVELLSATRILDLARGEADVALRAFRSTQPGLVARKLGSLGWGLFTSDAYVSRKGMPAPDRLADHDIICFQESLKTTPGQVWLDEHGKSARVVMRGNDTHSIALATLQGMGVSVLPCFLAVAHPGLKRVSPGVVAAADVFAVMAADLKHLQRVRAVVDMLVELFTKHSALFAGTG
jgi:DNA-binding transcriptional LysR family regulator